MIDELPRVDVLMAGGRVQEFRYTEVCIDIVAHGGFIARGINVGVVKERGSTGHIGIVCGDVHGCDGRCEVERGRR